MNDSINKLGKHMAIITYVFGFLVIYTFMSYGGNATLLHKLSGALVGVLSLILLLLFYRKDEKGYLFVLTFLALTTVYSVLFAIIGSDKLMPLMAFFMQWMIALMLFEKRICGWTIGFQIAGFVVMLFAAVTGVADESLLTFEQFACSLICLVFIAWMAINIIDYLTVSSQQRVNQKQSVDDLLNVVQNVVEEASETSGERSELLSTISMQLSGPLKNIISLNEMLADDRLRGHVHEYTDKIDMYSRELLKMSEDILSYSAIEREKLRLNENEYHLGKLLEKQFDRFVPEMKKKGLELRVYVEEHICCNYIGDGQMLGEILGYLIDNAVRYTDRGSICIKIHAQMQEKKHAVLQFDVEDTGRGIRRKDREHIFEAFYRDNEKNGASTVGVGLGLYMAAQKVQSMHGTLSVASEYGKGSVFTITIPQYMTATQVKEGELQPALLYDYLEGYFGLSLFLSDQEQEENQMQSDGQIQSGSQMQSEGQMQSAGRMQSKAISAVEGKKCPDIPGIDWKKAYEYLAEWEVIVATFTNMYSISQDTIGQLEASYERYRSMDESALEDYQIRVHAIKSTTKMVGAMDLSAKAKMLEYAAKDGERTTILENTDAFIEEYRQLMEHIGRLDEVKANLTVEKEQFDQDEVLLKLDELKKAMEEYNMEWSDRAIEQLDSYDYPKQLQDLISELGKAVLGLDHEYANRLIEQIKNELKS